MSTTVTFGPVTAHPVLGGYAVVVGSGNQWNDDSDATYAEMDALPATPPSAASAPQVATPGVVAASTVSLTARISGPAGVLHPISPAFALLTAAQLAVNPTAQDLPLGYEIDGGVPLFYVDDLGGGNMSTDPDGLAHTYTVDLPYTTAPFGIGVWSDIGARLAPGDLFLTVFVGNAASNTDLLRVYEVSLTVTTGSRTRRKYPNPTGLAVGPRRHWPHPRRGVTGYN